MSRINPKYLENMTLFSRPLRHNVHFGVHWHYSQCWAMLQTLDKNSLGVKKPPAKHATCCLFLPWPLSVLTQRACLYAGGHVILCMRVGRRGKRVSFVFSLSKCVERDSKRNRRAECGGWGVGWGGCCRYVSVFVRGASHMCECDWLIGGSFSSTVCSRLSW